MGLHIIIRNWKWAVLIIVFWFIAFRYFPRGFYDLGGDSAQYIILGESLAKGTGLRLVNFPHEPASFYFPPVLCFLLSPIIYFFGRNYYLMHIVIAALGFLSLFFFYKLFRRYSDTLTAVLSVFLLATNWAFVIYSAQYILSDVPYLFFSSLTLFLALRYSEECACFNKTGIFLILGLILSYFTRYSGLVLFLSIVSFLFLAKRKNKFGKIALIGSIFLLVFCAWNILEALQAQHQASHNQLFFLIDPYAPDRGTIFAHPFELLRRFAGGINRVFVLLGDVSFFYFINKSPALNDTLCGIILIFVSLGFWFKFREDKYCIFHYYFLFYLFLLFLWLFTDFIEGVRYLLPILAFLIFYFISGFLGFLRFFPKRVSAALLPVFICVFFVLNVFNLGMIPKPSQININGFPLSFRNFVILHDWMNKNLTDKAKVILSRKPTITSLFTGHKAITYPYTSDKEKIWSEIVKDNVKYIIVDEFSRETYYYLLPVLYRYDDKVKILHRIGNTGLLEIKEGG